LTRFSYQCSECGQTYPITPETMLCARCSAQQAPNEPLRGVLEVTIDDVRELPESPLDLLPVEKQFFPKIPVGNTPLWEPENLRKRLGFPNLFVKDDTANPTGSLKDRASYLVAAFARKHGIKDIVLASTGNAASSMSGVGAAAALNIVIFIPKAAPKAKRVQSMQYGARVMLVDGTYDLAFDRSLEYSKTNGGFNRNTAYNPLTIEGKKTVALEIVSQLAAAGKGVPDNVFVPVGDGVILAGVYKAFIDLKKLKIIDRIPTVFCVQAEGSSAIARAFETGKFESRPSHTVADSISVDAPRNGYLALKQLKAHNGRCVQVSDDAILEAQKELSSSSGLFVEPASAAAVAGFLAVKDTLAKESTTVILVTGNGLKDIDAAQKKLEDLK
jgi:threonine synthase